MQAARESARRTQCTNNLKQIGLGLHNYHSAKGEFPPGTIGDGGPPAPVAPDMQFGWAALTLPYMEQDAVDDQFQKDPDPAKPGLLSLKQTLITNPNVAKTLIPSFLCPTDTSAGISGYNDDRTFNAGIAPTPTPFTAAKSSYPGNGGNAGGTGIFEKPAVVRTSQSHQDERHSRRDNIHLRRR